MRYRKSVATQDWGSDVPIGAKVLELRKRKGISRHHLAVAADVSPATIDRLEREERVPKLELLGRIASALDATVIDLMESPPEHSNGPSAA